MVDKYSDAEAADKVDGGDIGWYSRDMLKQVEPETVDKFFALQAGQISDVIESRRGFHIIQVTDKRPEGTIPFDQAKDKIRARLLARERQDKLRAYVDQLKEQARVERNLPAAS